MGPAHHDEREAVVGRQCGPAPIGSDGDLEAVDREVAEVRVEAGLQIGLVVVLLGADRLRDP